jgi:class IV lanthipeptide synthase
MTRGERVERLPNSFARQAERDWQQLCDAFLPVRPRGSIWWLSRGRNSSDLSQGWKLHVSATILSANRILRLVAPYLRKREILFKAPKSLAELQKLNAGIYYGFSQIGKFITVYPSSTEAALVIAAELDSLTANQPAPMVPYDNALRNGSCIYYRYGSFSSRVKMSFRGKRVSAIARTDGKLVPDRRKPGSAVPHWLRDPFQAVRSRRAREFLTPLETKYRDYEALVQRGRGGVYRALDLSSTPARPCIIKEGRRHGETDWNGCDGYERLQCEARFLRTISRRVGAVPRVVDTFQANDCFYLVMEPVAGRPLSSIISGRERISKGRTLAYCLGMARIVADIHAAGWVWRDCKPDNFLCQKNCELRALDFEGACQTQDSKPRRWATPGYLPPEWPGDVSNLQAGDLYALGISFAQLITRRISPSRDILAFNRRAGKQRLPQPLVEAARNLLSPQPEKRPPANTVQRALAETLFELRR